MNENARLAVARGAGQRAPAHGAVNMDVAVGNDFRAFADHAGHNQIGIFGIHLLAGADGGVDKHGGLADYLRLHRSGRRRLDYGFELALCGGFVGGAEGQMGGGGIRRPSFIAVAQADDLQAVAGKQGGHGGNIERFGAAEILHVKQKRHAGKLLILADALLQMGFQLCAVGGVQLHRQRIQARRFHFKSRFHTVLLP